MVVFKKSALGIYKISPMILGILGLASLLMVYLKPENIEKVFSGNVYLDTIYGTLLGSLMLGNAIISYILGGELLNTGISMYAITAFLLSWTSIGYVQIPLEISFFGRKFVILRTLLAIIFTLILSGLIVWTYETIK